MSLLMEALKKAERAKQGQPSASDRDAPEQTQQSSIEREIPTLLASDFDLEPPRTAASKKEPVSVEKSSQETSKPFQTEAHAQSYSRQGDSDLLRTEARDRSHARSVFTAKRPASNRKLQIAGISLVAMAAIAGAVVFYWPTLSALIPGLAPHTASTTPRPAAPATPPAPVPAPASTATPEPAPSASDEENAQAKETPTTIAANSGKDATPAPQSAPQKKSARRSPMKTAAQATAGDEMEPVETNESTQAPARRGSRSSREKSDIQFRQNVAAIQVNPILSGAYQAFISGNLEMAQQQYQKFLRQEPNSRDALLGLAAIAAKQQQLGQAAAYYNKLLELDPADPDAMAGMNGVQGQADPVQNESRLKKMLQQTPQAGALHFALGNLYSQQLRWAEAQQAYFRAYGCTPGNADYAFNLAISLEHLNQNKLALDYYQRAIALSQSGPANFDKTSVQNRTRELQQSAGK